MTSSAAKLVALFLLLGLGFYQATSSKFLSYALVYEGDKKSLSYVLDRKGVLRRITAQEEGSIRCANLKVVEHKPVPSRSLRVLLIPPLAPIRNKAKDMNAAASPTPLIS